VATQSTWTPASLLPTAWYKADSNAVDSSGNGYDAAWRGAAAYSVGVNGQAFNTTSAMLTNLNAVAAALGNAPAATVCAWIMRTTAGQQDTIMDLSINDSLSKINLAVLTNNTLRCGARAAATDSFQSRVTTGTLATTGVWYHVVAVIDVAGDAISLYTNGVAAGATGTPAWTTTSFAAGTGKVSTLGSGLDFGFAVDGRIDDILVFGRALTQAEITNLYAWRQ
jgi:hypothetical protein